MLKSNCKMYDLKVFHWFYNYQVKANLDKFQLISSTYDNVNLTVENSNKKLTVRSKNILVSNYPLILTTFPKKQA